MEHAPRYAYIWEFEVAAEQLADFFRHYGPSGTWAQLFRRSEGYLETILLQDQQSPGRYLTVDRWASSEAHDAFLQKHRLEYERMDALCESLIRAERSLGSYWEVPANASAA